MKRFTLIELLTVIGIVAILFSLLMPALMKSRGTARSIQCVSNIKQLGMAFMLYASDNRYYLPKYDADINRHGGMNWANYTLEYHNNTKLLDCPTSPDGPPENNWRSLHLYDGNYGWNYDGTQGANGKLTKILSVPSQIYLLFDSGDQCITYGANTWDNLMEELDLDWDSKGEGCNRHNGKVNIHFADGHVASRSLLEFLAVPNSSLTVPWLIEWKESVLVPGEIPYSRH